MYQRILVPVDGSAPGRRALDEAIRIGRKANARLLLMHVAQVPLGPEMSPEFAAGADVMYQSIAAAGNQTLRVAQGEVEAAGVAVEVRLVGPQIDAVAPSIVETASEWRADLIVMGTHGRRGLDHLMLGSVAERVLRVAPVPVLMVRPGH